MPDTGPAAGHVEHPVRDLVHGDRRGGAAVENRVVAVRGSIDQHPADVPCVHEIDDLLSVTPDGNRLAPPGGDGEGWNDLLRMAGAERLPRPVRVVRAHP